ncbi:MAG: B12-binding domain-containing radical SAM protein [Elusimicrobiota bacterium]|nr:MAG: B12-binding domain-containing radical SAM protein [Elusimicrobiota bacterium]
MKVLLVNPWQGRLVSGRGRVYNRAWTPLDLATTAAVLRGRGIEAAILDANALRLGPAEAGARCAGFDRVFVTSTSLDRWQCPHLDLAPFLETVAAAKAAAPEVYVMGSHGTVLPAEMLALTGARAVVRGEPEGIVPALAAGAPLAEVLGITWSRGGETIHNADAPPVRLDDLPAPAFDLLPLERYSYEVMGGRFVLLEMSRGCASECNFCLLKTYGDGVRRKSVPRLAAEIEAACALGARTAYFIDLEFTVLRKQVLELCDWLIEKNLDFEWCCQTRLDLVDDELLERMRRAKCTLIHFGVEAGSDVALATLNKGITMAAIREGMRKVKKAGIRTATFFMFGFPESTERDMDDVEAFARELAPDYPLFHVVAPYPGTALHDRVKSDPALRFSDDTLFPEAVEAALTLADLKRLTRRAYLRYYLRPGYLLGRLAAPAGLAAQLRLFWSFVTAR